MTRKFLVMLVIASLSGCGGREENSIGERDELENIKDLLSAAPRSVVDLDASDSSTVYPEMVIGGISDSQRDEVYLASPVGTFSCAESLYVCDRLAQGIIVVEKKSGRIVRKIGRKGHGPTEFIAPYQIAGNDSIILVYDFGNSRVQLFSHLFKYIASLPASFPPVGTSIGASNDKLIIRGNFADTTLISVRSSSVPFPRLRSFLPRIVPNGKQPSAKNNIRFSVNRSGWICVGYPSTPFVFVFDPSGRLSSTIELRGNLVERLRGPVKIQASGGIPVRVLIFALLIQENLDIILASGSEILFMKRRGEFYEMSRRYLLRHRNAQIESESTMIVSSHILLDEGKLYVCNPLDSHVEIFSLEQAKSTSISSSQPQ